MTQSITLYVDVNVTAEGPSPLAAGLDTMVLVLEHSVITTSRLAGPYTSVAEIVAAGFPAGGVAATWAADVFGQMEHIDQVYIGRRLAGPEDLTTTLTAIKAENPGAVYGWTIATRTDADILDLAAWIQGEGFGIAGAQTDSVALLNGTGPQWTLTFGGTETNGDYVTEFDGGGLVAPVSITTTRAGGVPATNAALATQHAIDILAETGIGGDLEGVVTNAVANGAVVTVTFARGLLPLPEISNTTAPAPGTLVAAQTDADVAGQLFAAQYERIYLTYHADDADYLEAAWMSLCLAFDLDVQKGIWAYKRTTGIPGDDLTSAQVAAIRSVNANYFSPAVMSSGLTVQAFTAQGWVPFGEAAAGRRIDIMTTIDWAKARFEEEFFDTLLRSPRGVRYTDAGISRFDADARGVLQRGVKAEHFLGNFTVPEDEPPFAGLITPSTINVPRASELTSAQRASRELTFGALAYFAQSIERVVFNFNVRN